MYQKLLSKKGIPPKLFGTAGGFRLVSQQAERVHGLAQHGERWKPGVALLAGADQGVTGDQIRLKVGIQEVLSEAKTGRVPEQAIRPR